MLFFIYDLFLQEMEMIKLFTFFLAKPPDMQEYLF